MCPTRSHLPISRTSGRPRAGYMRRSEDRQRRRLENAHDCGDQDHRVAGVHGPISGHLLNDACARFHLVLSLGRNRSPQRVRHLELGDACCAGQRRSLKYGPSAIRGLLCVVVALRLEAHLGGCLRVPIFVMSSTYAMAASSAFRCTATRATSRSRSSDSSEWDGLRLRRFSSMVVARFRVGLMTLQPVEVTTEHGLQETMHCHGPEPK